LTYNEVADKIGKSPWTIRDRIVLLKQRGIIKSCRPEIDYGKLGFGCKAIIGFNVPPEKIAEFIVQMKKEKRIKKITITTGSRRFHINMIGNDCTEIRDYARKALPQFGIYNVDFEVILDEII